MIREELVPSEDCIFSWIEEVYRHGARRPGYPADRWAEEWAAEQFRAFGLENVRAEPVPLWYWEDRSASLIVEGGGGTLDVPCFALPHSTPADRLEAGLVAWDSGEPGAVKGAMALYGVQLNRPPHGVLARLATWAYDPDGTYENSAHALPFAREMMHVVEPAIEAGAAAFIGTLSGYPGNSYHYYVPYDAVERPIPGVWISGSDGARLCEMLAAGPCTARLRVDAVREQITCYNIVGELPGADDETVIIGSHHDGPWASAVEDGSGIALVLAQAAYWSRVPREERPHRLVFLLNAGHMAGGAGQATFVETHRDELDRCVLEVHLEHAAAEFSDEDGELRATGLPESRWWFTTRLAALEATVRGAIEAEDLRRSLILPPTAFGPKPTTDGADFHLAGVPLVHFLAAPWYLFDAADTLDKIHRAKPRPNHPRRRPDHRIHSRRLCRRHARGRRSRMTADPYARLREICLAFPEAVEKPFGGHTNPAFRVHEKIFCGTMEGDGRPSVTLKAPPGAQEFFVGQDPERFFRPAYVGPKGWLGIRIDTPSTGTSSPR